MFDLSLSIVSYNNKHDIEECLDSLYRTQSGKCSMQVFIVNNSQTERCDDLEEKYPVKVIQLPTNEGFGKGHNAVLPLIDSRYHAIVNPAEDVQAGLHCIPLSEPLLCKHSFKKYPQRNQADPLLASGHHPPKDPWQNFPSAKPGPT